MSKYLLSRYFIYGMAIPLVIHCAYKVIEIKYFDKGLCICSDESPDLSVLFYILVISLILIIVVILEYIKYSFYGNE